MSVSVWNGKTSLHDLYLSERDRLLWQQRSSALMDAAPGRSGLPTYKELPRQERIQRAAVKAKSRPGFCVGCQAKLSVRRIHMRYVRCARCVTQRNRFRQGRG